MQVSINVTVLAPRSYGDRGGLGSRVVSTLDSGAVGPGVQITVATLT